MKNKNLLVGVGLIGLAVFIYWRKNHPKTAQASVPSTSNASGCGCSGADGSQSSEEKEPLWDNDRGWGNGILY